MEISKNFRLREFTNSTTANELGIDNTKVPEYVKNNIKEMVLQVLQPLRDYIKKPILINSGYRCLKLNAAVGGVPTSQHVQGQAVDIAVKGITPFEIAQAVLDLYLPFDQLILYNSFVHLSISPRDRRQLLYNSDYNGLKFD